jgi:HTH-type transcriptional regulator, transcriptional repressor of NAD biosynthesis genes
MREYNAQKIGLVVGKFAPFHTGHEYLLSYAYAATDVLVVLVYEAEDCTRVPLGARVLWIQRAYPNAVVLEGAKAPARGVWNKLRMREHEEFIQNAVSEFAVTHVFSGEDYGERLAEVLGARHVRIEKVLGELPLSASALRREPAMYQQYVQPHVYDDLKKYGDVV